MIQLETCFSSWSLLRMKTWSAPTAMVGHSSMTR